MTKIAKSPERHTFQLEGAKKRAEESGKEIPEQYIEFWKTAKQQDEENLVDPEWQKDNMEYDLRSTDWIVEKVKSDEVYAQHLYAAMCNREFIKNDVWPILTEQKWSCSWRSAGGIIADMREEGDYIDWYCSGIRGDKLTDDEFKVLTNKQQEAYLKSKSHVGEGHVTDEIREDLLRLGWIVIDEGNERIY
jgi:hypothetical protein